MKKITVFVLCFVLVYLSACNSSIDKKDLLKEETTSNTFVNIESTQNHISHKNTEESIDIGGGFLTTRKYRVRYYSVPYQFILLVGENAYNDWKNQIANKTTDERNEMKIKRFIQHFNIKREDFDKANLEFAKVLKGDLDIKIMMNPQDYADQEIEEIFNADIIYSFNDEIINTYYLSQDYPFGMRIEYEEAVADGTYETRTIDWIDIEQMEAEIIAKYGETEIVTESTTAEQTETTTTEPPETTTVG